MEDVDRVMEIELSAYPHPWTHGIFCDCIRVGYDCWGVQLEERLVGYAVLSHAAGESHLLNLCVAPDWQGQGLGGLLLSHAFRRARRQGCDRMFLEVRPSNPAGIQLYLKTGFEGVGKRPGYYRSDDGREDAIIMSRNL
jgi:ribosomal-protein-alanine N-acetyltransferase